MYNFHEEEVKKMETEERILESMDANMVAFGRHFKADYDEKLVHQMVSWAYSPSLLKDDLDSGYMQSLALGEELARLELSDPKGKAKAWEAALVAMNLRIHVLLSRLTSTVNVSLDLERR